MKTLSFLIVLPWVALLAFTAWGQDSGSNWTSKPNFIVVLVDDLGWADLGCYGSEFHETPQLDRMAKEGIRFTNGYAAAAVCSPTRTALQTGLNPARTGVTDWIRSRFQGGIIPPDGKNRIRYIGGAKQKLLCPDNKLFLETEYLTIAEHLKTAGYTTCHIGKWHLGQEGTWPTDQGYDFNIAGCDLGQPPSYFDPYSVDRPDYVIPESILPRRLESEYLTDREADEAVRFIREHKEKPFFLHLAHYAVHIPLQAKAPLVEKYRNKLQRMKQEGIELPQKNAVYAAMLESVDDAIGRIIDTINTEKLAENTYIIFTSDNGGLLGPTSNAPLRSEKGTPYEGGIRVPFIVWGPGRIKAGAQSDLPVITYDVFSTICDWADIPLPDVSLDGVSIRSVTNSTTASDDSQELGQRPLIWHFPHYRGTVTPYSIIRQGDWKLIHYYENELPELYNLADDPFETKNIAEQENEVVTSLLRVLESRLDALDARRVKPNPAYKDDTP